MALQLFKLVIDATTTTTTAINPDVKRYFYLLDPDDIDDENDTLTISAVDMVDDTGAPLEAGGIPVIDPSNGYYLLFVNGVLQQSDLYTVTANEIVVQDIDEENINPNEPIVLVAASFAPTSSSTTTVTT
jgi:hypothetical protein